MRIVDFSLRQREFVCTVVFGLTVNNRQLTITESHPSEYFFTHNFISKVIDDEMKRTGELLGRNRCEKYLCPYLYVMEERYPRRVLSIRMASIYCIVSFIKIFTAWAG